MILALSPNLKAGECLKEAKTIMRYKFIVRDTAQCMAEHTEAGCLFKTEGRQKCGAQRKGMGILSEEECSRQS